jgi:hypothetical protein
MKRKVRLSNEERRKAETKLQEIQNLNINLEKKLASSLNTITKKDNFNK